MFELFRLLFGYVRFCAYGGFAERFVNLCDLQKVKVRSLSFNEERLEGFVTARDYKKLRPVAKRSGMRLSCLSKHGLPFFLFRNRNRVGLAIGAAFFAVFMCIMSLFLWSVDTVGSERLSREEILSVAKSFGLREGAFIPKIDVHELSDSMITEMNGKLLWAAVNISGCRAVIEVRDYIQKPESKTYGEPCNIVADFDGLLLSLQVYNGTKANREGNGVKKGDLLISGSSGWGLQPRTVIGQTRDGQLMLSVVDGRQPGYSLGITIGELSDIFYRYGAYQACNLDGGSSAVMYYRGRIITHSSAANSERGRHIPDGWIVTEPKI